MKSDPMDTCQITDITSPPSRGPGSGKEVWIAYAHRLGDANVNLWGIIDDQRAAIKDLEAEIELLRAQIATRKPKGGKPRLDDAKVRLIERDLEAGYSKRSIAKYHRVSAMSVVRIAERMAARQAA